MRALLQQHTWGFPSASELEGSSQAALWGSQAQPGAPGQDRHLPPWTWAVCCSGDAPDQFGRIYPKICRHYESLVSRSPPHTQRNQESENPGPTRASLRASARLPDL